MRLLEQFIRRYEHRRWATDQRAVLPFSWGLEHIGGRADESDPRGFLDEWVKKTLASSEEWFSAPPAQDYRLEGDELTFSTAVPSPWPENNLVHARFFPAGKAGPAVVVMAHWNAKPAEHVAICRWLNAIGISALRLTLPYHDSRATPGHERAHNLVGPNLGLTLLANRQAVCDARRCFRWLEQQGYGKLGVLGTSIGSSIAFITMAHDAAIRAGTFLHVSTYFGAVVSTGLTTTHVWEPLQSQVTREEIIRFWSPISPFPYVHRLKAGKQKALMVTGRYDPTFWPEFSEEMLAVLERDGIEVERLQLPCGHYSLGLPPFSWMVGARLGAFFMRTLA
ncbi:MAG: alpha/beta hydrolase family protein [Acidipila sp.]|nr:alpha/beta hydrolase family protein [Acidipila sp.]